MKFQKVKSRAVLVGVALLVFIITAISLLSKKGTVVDVTHTLPMIVFENKDKLWQVVTYDDEPVTALTIEIYPKYAENYKKVYINYRSQFVFSDGKPVLLNKEPLFWNRRGDIIDYDYNVISEGMVFYISGKGMKPRTAMTLKTLRSNLRSNVLKEKDKIRERQLEDIIKRGE
ncbi:hypothetical protein EI165_08610 [Pseudoalteromonas nigrifaciens]|uniref:hypothetical protein n=1 Tax=Pseudoalteromonas nigrifaciens TaxID=28109 RepID=UPI0017880B57|nr:hypothetical protein [Pseudoalteromonas nigrifaciens]MBE0420184.1 hypothetical protein [Pseudoalteromonas nigrifaciens]